MKPTARLRKNLLEMLSHIKQTDTNVLIGKSFLLHRTVEGLRYPIFVGSASVDARRNRAGSE